MVRRPRALRLAPDSLLLAGRLRRLVAGLASAGLPAALGGRLRGRAAGRGLLRLLAHLEHAVAERDLQLALVGLQAHLDRFGADEGVVVDAPREPDRLG